MKTYNAKKVTDLRTVATKLLADFPNDRIFAFEGVMGAGKTAIIKALCDVLGVEGEVTSPTFAIVNTYRAIDAAVYHFDFYRIEQDTEAMDIGFEEYLSDGNYCLIEWVEKVQRLMPSRYVRVEIKERLDGSRDLIAQRL
ncbi:MAG: tRNA (adenosine(37)-N6)-threonylcarbamoyltransferase complex ATPase subunit type 1 TsaE [Bacteroidales bacterium]|jgi:tRNA threonylcarbamoyladenosine biosynthesis protein TsaE|nr:tRNA (adenosine(37)-N6)-threonylcarbamoyltransferase complex ATPase subunit type 1 TsaE [Bacteroidales bacterium]